MNGDILTPRGQADFDLYPFYKPSDVAAWSFVVLFGIAAVMHAVWTVSLRNWYFIPFILGCIGEAGGYYGRAWSHRNIRNGSPYLVQMMLILGSAPLLAASIYMTLGRYIRALKAEKHATLSPRLITVLYVCIDIGSFVCQIMGSAAQMSGAEGAKTGTRIVMVGLAIQLVGFVGFIAMCVMLHMRLNREPTVESERPNVHWRKHIKVLYVASFLVLVRNLFRFIEFADGTGSLMKVEALLYIFDAALLVFVAFLLAVVYPGILLRSVRKAEFKYLSSDAIPLSSGRLSR